MPAEATEHWRGRPWRLVFTPLFLITMIVANGVLFDSDWALPESELEAWGVSLETLRAGEIFRLLSGSYLSQDLPMLIRQLALATLVIGFYEWRTSPLRAFGMFLFLDVAGTLLLMFGGIAYLDIAEIEGLTGLAVQFDVGMSAGGFGLAGAILCRLPWRKTLLLLGMVGLALKLATLTAPIADVAHLVMLPFGFLVQALLDRRV